MKFNLAELAPWSEIHRTLQNMRTLTVIADGVEHNGDAELTLDEEGNAVLSVGEAAKQDPAVKPRGPYTEYDFGVSVGAEKMPGEA